MSSNLTSSSSSCYHVLPAPFVVYLSVDHALRVPRNARRPPAIPCKELSTPESRVCRLVATGGCGRVCGGLDCFGSFCAGEVNAEDSWLRRLGSF